MQFNTQTQELFTDSGEHIKRLSCPKKRHWLELKVVTGVPDRDCTTCSRRVIDTAALTDDQVMALVQGNPETCLHLCATQGNITLIKSEAPAYSDESRRRSFIYNISDSIEIVLRWLQRRFRR